MAANLEEKPASSTMVKPPTLCSEEYPELSKGVTTQIERSEERPASTVTWRIEKVSFWDPHEHTPQISSPVFVLNNICENSWKLNLTRNKHCAFTVDLKTCRFVESVTIDAEWSLVNSDGSPLYTSVARYAPTTASSTHPMPLSDCRVLLNDDTETFVHNDALTIRVRIWKRCVAVDSIEGERISLVTQYVKKQCVSHNISWHIKKFSSLRLDKEATVTVDLRGDAFTMSFILTGDLLGEACVDFGISAAHAAWDQEMEVAIHAKCGRTKAWVPIVQGKHAFTSSARCQSWVLPNVISREEILDGFLVEDDLVFSCLIASDYEDADCGSYSYIEESYSGPERRRTVNGADAKAEERHCNGKIISIISDENVRTSLQPCNCDLGPQGTVDPLASKSILLHDIENIFRKQIFCDFELRSGNCSFLVHKNILCSRSAVFDKMLDGDMKEAKSIDVPGMDSATLGHFLNFLYTGLVPDLDWEQAFQLYEVALKFQVPSLTVECRNLLTSDISLSNVVNILELADRVKDQKLRSHVIDFIYYNFDAVVLSDEWSRFQTRSLEAGKIMNEVCKRRKAMRTK